MFRRLLMVRSGRRAGTKKPTRAGGFRLLPFRNILSGNQIQNPPGAAIPPPVVAVMGYLTAGRVSNHALYFKKGFRRCQAKLLHIETKISIDRNKGHLLGSPCHEHEIHRTVHLLLLRRSAIGCPSGEYSGRAVDSRTAFFLPKAVNLQGNTAFALSGGE
jgi:hypothetical protein